MPYAKTAPGDLFYTVSRGAIDSPALVLVHGAGGSRLHWPAQLRRLPGATVYTLDLPGHGRSAGPSCDTVNDYAQATAAFLDALEVQQATLVGHSMGGAVAMQMALNLAGRVSGLVLIATGARLRVAPAILEGIRTDFARSVDLITRFSWSAETSPRLARLGQQALQEAGAEVLLGDLAACDRFDVMGRLEEIRVPTLVVTGSADQMTPAKYAHFLVEHMAGARLVIIAGAGHMVMLERPGEVAQAIQGFLGR